MPEAPLIHIVEDDWSFQTAISRWLRAMGYEWRHPPGGTGATQQFGKSQLCNTPNQ